MKKAINHWSSMPYFSLILGRWASKDATDQKEGM